MEKCNLEQAVERHIYIFDKSFLLPLFSIRIGLKLAHNYCRATRVRREDICLPVYKSQ